jgi:hypothetical protein
MNQHRSSIFSCINSNGKHIDGDGGDDDDDDESNKDKYGRVDDDDVI